MCDALLQVVVSTPSVLTVRHSKSAISVSAASPSQLSGDVKVMIRTGEGLRFTRSIFVQTSSLPGVI